MGRMAEGGRGPYQISSSIWSQHGNCRRDAWGGGPQGSSLFCLRAAHLLHFPTHLIQFFFLFATAQSA